MKEKIINKFRKHPVLSVGILFVIFSLIINTAMILIAGRAYSNDIVHAVPTILFYEYVLDGILGGLLTTEFYLLPVILVIDFIIGIIVGFILNKAIKKESKYFIALAIIFVLYWFVICFQWLPII